MPSRVPRSLELYRRAAELIPGATQLISRRASQFAHGVSPLYATRAKGSRFRDVDGHEMELATMGRHSLFGETAVIGKGRRTATVRARDRVVTFKISADVFLDLVRQSPEISMQVMTVLAQRLESTSARLQQHQSHS